MVEPLIAYNDALNLFAVNQTRPVPHPMLCRLLFNPVTELPGLLPLTSLCLGPPDLEVPTPHSPLV